MAQFKLSPGDILINVNTGKDLWSWIRRWALNSPYTHVFLYLGGMPISGLKIPLLFESTGHGVCICSLSQRYGQEVVVMRLRPAWKERIPLILQEAIKLASDEKAYYDYYCIIRFILPRLIMQKLRLPLPLAWHRNPAQVCSEAVAEIHLRADVPVLPDNIVPLPGDFVTKSPLLYKVGQGNLSEDWV